MATKVEELRQTASSAWDEYSVEMAKYSDDTPPNEEQRKHITALRKTATEAQKELRTAEDWARDRSDWEDQQERMRGASHNNNGHRGPPGNDDDGDLPVKRQALKSIGRRFVEAAEYKGWLDRFAPNGRFPEKTSINSPPLRFDGFKDIARSAALVVEGTAAGGGALLVPGQYAPITEFGRRPLTIRDIITNLQTESDTVEFVRITTETSNAAPVAEATATGGTSGTKPESALAFERVTTPVKTVAHWMPATNRILSDAAQLRGLIDSFLTYYLDIELEDQIIQGDGTGDNFDGILSTSGIQTQAWDAGDTAGGVGWRTARIAKRKVLTVGRRRPTAFLLNPEDWEKFDLAEDAQRRFYSQGPFESMLPRLWGLPVVETEAVPVGVGLVGDFNMAVLWDREQGSVTISNSHADFFIRNLLAILAELRAAFGVLKPNAFVSIDLTP